MADPPPASLPSGPRRRPRWLLPVVIAVIVALVAAGAWYVWGRTSDPATKADAADAKAKGGKGAGKGGRGGGPPGGIPPVAAGRGPTGAVHNRPTPLGTGN